MTDVLVGVEVPSSARSGAAEAWRLELVTVGLGETCGVLERDCPGVKDVPSIEGNG